MKRALCNIFSVLMLLQICLNTANSQQVVEWRLDETSGTTADDSTINGNDGTVVGTANWVSGIKNNCLQFDGIDNAVMNSSASNLPTVRTAPWTINMCVYVDSEPSDFTVLGGFGNPDGFWGEARYIVCSDAIQFWGQGIDVKSNYTLDAGRWQMLTITFEGEESEGAFGKMTIYKNCKEIKSDYVSFYEHDCLPHINLAPDIYTAEWDELFAGKIDEFSIFDTALSAEDVDTLRQNIGLTVEYAAWPYPEDGSPVKTGYRAVDPAVVLYWDSPLDVNSPLYNVYFGTNPASLSLESQNQSANSFDPYGATELAEDTTYYWRIDVNDTDGGTPVIHTGDVWSFTTWQSSATKVLEWKLDSASGSVAEDSTANNNDGTLLGEPQWVKGLVGNCLQFDGIDDSVQITEAVNLPVNPTDAWSVNMYVYSATSQPGRVLGGFGQPIDPNWGESRYLMVGNNNIIQFWAQSIDVYTESVFELDEWQMFTVVYQGSDANDWGQMRVYRDGVEQGYEWVNFYEHGTLAQAYLSPGVWGNYFSGLMDEFTIWQGALTETQIEQLAEFLPPAGDINNDGNVNFEDFSILAADWLITQ